MLVLKGLILLSLGVITYQDLKSRAVYWFLFPILIGMLGVLHYNEVLMIHFVNAVGINLAIIVTIFMVLYSYTVLRIKRPFFKEVFGIGDALFFLALAMAFPSVTFVIIFVFSLLFSLLTWLILKKNSKHNSVPLAGYMSIFLILIFIIIWSNNSINLYLI